MRTPRRGLFHCPQCDASRAYAYRRVRRFFVLLFVPVVPLSGEKEFVQCGFCRRAFTPSILESNAVVTNGETAKRRAPHEECTTPEASTLLVWSAEDKSHSGAEQGRRRPTVLTPKLRRP